MKNQNNTERRSSMEPVEGSREDMRGSSSSSSSERGRSSSSERGTGSSSERGMGSSSGMRSGSSDSGGISNRERSREQCEQDQLPERGKSQSES